MQRIIALSTLLLIPNPDLELPPDLCAEVHVDADGYAVTDDNGVAVSRLCEPTGPEPPVWGGEVCCELGDEEAKCRPPVAGDGCDSGLTMWCEYGELIDGEVVCYQPFEDACAAGLCRAGGYQAVPQEGGELLCCNGPCVAFDPYDPMCDGELYYCWAPFQHESGAVECYGGEPL